MDLALDWISKIVNGEIHLNNISLKIESGATNVLLGHTLAGKTSLLRIMASLDCPKSCCILLAEETLPDCSSGKEASPWSFSNS